MVSYKELIVWQKSIGLVTDLYKLTVSFPKEEIYGLVSQIRRAAVSIPSNIAEGKCRGSKKDFRQFLRIAYGSGAELETQLLIAEKLSFGQKIDYTEINQQLDEIMRMLNTIIMKLKPSLPHPSNSLVL